MYPSVSICKKYAFETLVFNPGQENVDINQLVQSVQENTWGLDQQFYFLQMETEGYMIKFSS